MYEVSVLFITDMEECQGHQTLWSNDHFYHRQLHVASSELDVQNNLHTYPYGVYQKTYLIKEHYIQCNPTLDEHYITICTLKAHSLLLCSFNFIILFLFVQEQWTIPRTSIRTVISTSS